MFVVEPFAMWLKILSTSGHFFFSRIISIADRTWGLNKSISERCFVMS